MKFTDPVRWALGLVILAVLAISITLITNLNTSSNFDELNSNIGEKFDKLNTNLAEKFDETNANLGGKIDSSSEQNVAAIEETKNTIVGAIVDTTNESDETIVEAIVGAINESDETIVGAINDSSTAIVNAIQSTLGNSSQESDSPSESSDVFVENTSGSTIFAVVENENQEVFLSLAGAIQETGLVPSSEVLSPIVLISLNSSIGQEDLTRIRSLSRVPVVKENFVTYNENSAEYALFWNILAPSIVPPHLEGAPLTISFAITN